jgi:hypothetical protein
MCLSKKEEILIEFLILFYKDRIEILKDIIYQNNPLSLRLIDWLVTNYSKKYNIIYPINKKGEDVIYFNIYLDYKNQLKAYSKKFFDPFCRQKRIIIDCETFLWKEYSEPDPDSTNDSTNIVNVNVNVNVNKNNFVITTVGQLNFFRWFLENKIFEYAIANIKLIDFDMSSVFINKKKGKRIVLSQNAVKGVFTSSQVVTLKF